MPRVRFAPSPTGFLHIGSARTYIFNWLFARHNGGTMILRIDDTDVGRNTEASVTSIFDGLRWLDLPWDELYKQSDRLALHREVADAIFEKGLAYRDFTPRGRRRFREVRRAGHVAVQSRYARALARRKRPARRGRRAVRAALPRAARNRGRGRSSPTRCMASSRRPTPIWRTSRCCAATACPRIIWRAAPTTPTCASRTLSAARSIFRTPSSTSSSSTPPAPQRRRSRICRC